MIVDDGLTPGVSPSGSGVAEERSFKEECPRFYGCLVGLAKWTAFYAVVVPLAVFFPVLMFGFAIGFICASILAAWEIGAKVRGDAQ